MQWLNLVVSGAAAIGAIASAFIAWRVYRNQNRAQDPYLTVDFEGLVDPDRGFATIRFHITNPGDAIWELERAVIHSPRKAVILNEAAIPRDRSGFGSGSTDYSWVSTDSLTRSATFYEPISSKSNKGTFGSEAPYFHGAVLVYPRSSARSINVSIRFILVSKDADQRKIEIAMKRTLKALTKTATA